MKDSARPWKTRRKPAPNRRARIPRNRLDAWLLIFTRQARPSLSSMSGTGTAEWYTRFRRWLMQATESAMRCYVDRQFAVVTFDPVGRESWDASLQQGRVPDLSATGRNRPPTKRISWKVTEKDRDISETGSPRTGANGCVITMDCHTP